MEPPLFTSPLWLNALTLAERNALLVDLHSSGSPHHSNAEAGQRRLDRWRAQSPFEIDSYFAQRIAIDGITQEQLLSILSEPIETFHKCLPNVPAWLEQVEEAFAHSQRPFDDAQLDLFQFDEDEAEDETSIQEEEIFDFLELVRPLIDQACEQLQAGVATLIKGGYTLPFDPETIEDVLLENLPEPLLMRLSRTLVLELHVARLQGFLDGDTPTERFESFIKRLRQPEVAIAILAEYSVLTRQITICLSQWTEVCLEFLTRLCQDWELIRCRLSPDDDPGLMVQLAGGAGDTHRRGRSVMIATFESDFQVVYKPKSLKIDQHFQELLTWLNDKGCEPPLQTIVVLDRGDYGWVEFVAYQSCSTLEELKRFFRRHGAYLALLYALNSNDFHFENLIAVGEHPLLIDLETLLQPSFDIFDETRAEIAAEKVMAESVLQVGLLPARMWSSDDYAGIDISGLGGMAGQLSPDRLPQLTDAGTDAMRYVRQRIEIAGDANRPSLNGTEVSATEHVEDIVTGFTTMYQLLMAHRDELLASDGPIDRCAHDEIRVLLRPTRTYDQLLTESFHPDLLRDALKRDLFLDRLWIAATVRSYLTQVIASEQADLQSGDIPIFTSYPASLDLYGTSSEGIGGVLHESGMMAVHRRIGQLSDHDLQRQVWFIRASIATLEPTHEIPQSTHSKPLANEGDRIDNAQLLTNADAIASHLAATAIYGADDVSWIGMDLLDQQNWTVRTLGVDLYSGISGIALFLAYAGSMIGEERYTTLARRTLNSVVGQMELLQGEMPEIGGFEGWGGLLYTLSHLAILWDDQGILSQAKGVVAIIADLVMQDDKFDIGRGSAGAIVTLLAFHQTFGDDKALDAAIACGDHLLAAAQRTQQGLYWDIPAFGAKPQSALRHSNTGIAWALLKLAATTGSERYAVAAQQARDYDRTLDSSITENKPNLEGGGLSVALDLGLAHLCLLQHMDEPNLTEGFHRCLGVVQAHGFAQSHSLHHGEMGRIDFLLQANRVLDDDQSLTGMERMTALGVENIEVDGWQCGGPHAVEMPGLMLGLAGIGYGMLRLLDPERVPSIQVLALPPHSPKSASKMDLTNVNHQL